ncbi:cytochrome b561 and DOMON domain-containing protein At3g07570-like [Bidens hawaiensis]|uniref:cytochrome b561 and DOMON domain-containing protein At3g07570-like n=1 Tax=Bidens hawaiensis TaxID=980011 RepID=UPI00404B80B7
MNILSNLHFCLILGCYLHVIHSQVIQDSCASSSLENLNAQILFDTSSLLCSNVWSSEGFILRASQTGPSLWSFVLSAPSTNSYVAMGFSPTGGMVGSSAIVGWVAKDGSATMQSYFLGGKTPSQVLADQRNIQVMPNSSSIITFSSRMYLAFQLITYQPSSQLVFAVGGSLNQAPSPPSFRLTIHRNQLAVAFNYASGEGNQISAPYSDLKRTHGILNAVGWGVLLPIGAMIARYFKDEHKSYWFYAHVTIQLSGFIIGLAGIITGLVLNDRIDVNVAKHKAIGLIVVTLGCLQIMALLVRPSKGSDMKKYWNWYHHNVGRVLIILAAFNVFYGVYLADGGSEWNVTYGVFLCIIVTIALSLELRLLNEEDDC